MAKKASTKKGSGKPSKPTKKPAAKKAEKASEPALTELEAAKLKIAALEAEVRILSGTSESKVVQSPKAPTSSLSFPNRK